MITVGLTGSIAMGKTEAGRMFAAAGVPVFDSDAYVHELYSAGGDATSQVAVLVPAAMSGATVDRGRLSDLLRKDADLLPKIEAIVHPMVREGQRRFLAAARRAGAPFVVLDIPLLFETGRHKEVDRIAVVSCSPEIQRTRALARPGMTDEKLAFILMKQVPDTEKRRQADFIIDTSGSLQKTATQIHAIITTLMKG